MIERDSSSRARGLKLTLAGAILFASLRGVAAELVFERSAVQKLVEQSLFNDEQGRHYLQKGDCYAYLEYPSVSLANGRVSIRAHISSRLGFSVGGKCLGPGFASDVTVSGIPSVSGARLQLHDIDIDHVSDSATQALLDVGLKQAMPRAIDYDVLPAVKKMVEGKEGWGATVDSLSFSTISAALDKLSLQFEFRLTAR